jgi:hypothetical protein
MARFKMIVGLGLLGLSLLVGCGVTKELLPERPASSLPDMPVKEKPVEEAGTIVVKKEELLISHANETLKPNFVRLSEGAEKYARIQKQFRVPIQFDGWLMVSQLVQTTEKCTGAAPAPKIWLTDDLNGRTLMMPEQKIHVVHEKLYVLQAVFENEALCSAVDIQFGVLFGE